MSAIAGVLHHDGRPAALDGVERMMRTLAALGPDRQAIWQDGAVALGVRQMTLLPEDRFDRQPWRAQEGALVLVANGRIDNRNELAAALSIDAAAAHAMADSELLFGAYQRWGKACLERIVGEFSFAAWHGRERRLFCARSQLEAPPLYYHRGRGFTAFATTAHAFFALPDVPRALDERRLACALALLPGEADETFYRDVSCLRLGHCLSIAGADVTVERYWRLDVGRRIRLARDQDYVEAAREQFDRAVAARLRSVQGIGSHLSAGCDSSAVTATAARLLNSRAPPLTAFTAAPREGFAGGAPGQRIADESPLAAQVAATIANLSHVVVRSNAHTPLDLARAHLLYGRPVQNPCNLVWVEQILDAARERRIRTLLIGNGGNMSISYDGLPRLAALLRGGRWLALAREAAALRRRGVGRRPIIDAALGPFMPSAAWGWWRRYGKVPTLELAAYSAINPVLAAEVDLDGVARRRGRELGLRPFADGRLMRRMLFEEYDRGDYRNGFLAGWGIDTRDPTSDRRLVEFCLAIPEDQYLRAGETKRLYRLMFEPVLPTAALVARKRGYQAADWHEGLSAARSDVAAELERMERSAGVRRALDLPRLRQLVEHWPSGDWQRVEVAMHYRQMLTRGMAAGMFIRSVEGGNE